VTDSFSFSSQNSSSVIFGYSTITFLGDLALETFNLIFSSGKISYFAIVDFLSFNGDASILVFDLETLTGF